MEKQNVIVEKSLDFGVEIVKFCELLEKKRKFVVAKQLLRSGTSIGANVFEAQHPESKSDFIHKMKLAIKEANETFYWLCLCERSENYPVESSLKIQVGEIIRIFSKIIISSRKGGKYAVWIFLTARFIDGELWHFHNSTLSHFTHFYYGALYDEPYIEGLETEKCKRPGWF